MPCCCVQSLPTCLAETGICTLHIPYILSQWYSPSVWYICQHIYVGYSICLGPWGLCPLSSLISIGAHYFWLDCAKIFWWTLPEPCWSCQKWLAVKSVWPSWPASPVVNKLLSEVRDQLTTSWCLLQCIHFVWMSSCDFEFPIKTYRVTKGLGLSHRWGENQHAFVISNCEYWNVGEICMFWFSRDSLPKQAVWVSLYWLNKE